jgi:hypothetical protein
MIPYICYLYSLPQIYKFEEPMSIRIFTYNPFAFDTAKDMELKCLCQ